MRLCTRASCFCTGDINVQGGQIVSMLQKIVWFLHQLQRSTSIMGKKNKIKRSLLQGSAFNQISEPSGELTLWTAKQDQTLPLDVQSNRRCQGADKREQRLGAKEHIVPLCQIRKASSSAGVTFSMSQQGLQRPAPLGR